MVRRGSHLWKKPPLWAWIAILLGAIACGVLLAVEVDQQPSAGTALVETDTAQPPPSKPTTAPVIAAAGDIACAIGQVTTATSCRQAATADILATLEPDAVLPLGDTQYGAATATGYARVYDPTWGRFKGISRPVVGNHEYRSPGAAGYFDYFGHAAGEPGEGYYSWDIGAWHLIALNSECSSVAGGGCAPGSAQERWLTADLAEHAGKCILAYWHMPRFSSSDVNNAVLPFWQALYEAGADVILNGHTHAYQRFAPQSPTGDADALGPRQFVVGTGGVNLHPFTTPTRPNEEVRQNTTFGVLELVLHADSYEWEFVPEADETWTDSGSHKCHFAD